jgi:NAD(P)-dependent dehydrogenase (short-subunit alcohol dehydrogenase family)
MRGLKGKAVLVAGGAGRIGTATSMRLAAEGAKVAVADLDKGAAADVADQITKAGGSAFALELDIGDEEAVAAAVKATVGAFGGLDALHANAADLSPETILKDSDALNLDLEVFDRTIRTNLRGHLLCTRYAVPELLGRGGGALVYTSSAAAFVGDPERPSYAMAKSAINALVRHVASRWGREGIRANAVAPGVVVPDAVRNALDPSFMEKWMIRSSRAGRPDDVAAMVAFLISSDGEWINGQVISVDGGATLR